MKMFIYTIILGIVSGCAAIKPDAHCVTENELAKFKSWINKIDSYKAELDVMSVNSSANIRSNISGITGKRLKIELITQAAQFTASQTAYFDGDYQWVESKGPMGTSVVRLRVEALTTPDRPFDTSLYLMGAGLINGEDFPASLRVLIDVYDFETKCEEKNNELVLFGNINKVKLTKYLGQSRHAKMRLKSVEEYAKSFERLILVLDKSITLVKKYSFGSKDNAGLTFILKSIEINPGLQNESFSYVPDESVKVEDITEQVLNR